MRVKQLRAQILERTALIYPNQAASEHDRPAFVRAASGLCWWQNQLFIAQDDNHFLGVWTPDPSGSLAHGKLESWMLAPGAEGRRRFEHELGNRLHKSDFEACTVVPTPAGERLLVLGSGSLPRRELALLLDPQTREPAAPVLVPALFDAFRKALNLSATETNLEGVSVLGSTLWLYQRGPQPAAVAFELEPLLRLIAGQAQSLLPSSVQSLDLGTINGVPYGLSDVTSWGERRLFLAVAEDTSNPVDDGEILGTLVGILDGEVVHSARLLDERGEPARVKAEGLVLARVDTPRDAPALELLIALDADDPTIPAELCRVSLSGL